ncbi:MAG: amidohydrolase family protein [Ilumatobacteraceae bacterium]
MTMPLQEHMKLISVDDHVVEHPMVWQDRLTGRHRERGPRMIEAPPGAVDAGGQPIQTGAQAWLVDGVLHPTVATNAVAGRPKEEFGFEPFRLDQVRPGCYDPVERVRDMDLDGVQAQLCFPTLPRFAGTLFLTVQDRELALDCVRAYNDFILDEWCGAAPDRLIPLVILPLWDVEASVVELQRTAAAGAKAAAFPEGLTPLGLPSIHTGYWDPVFALSSEAGIPLCLHFGTSGQRPTVSVDSPEPVWISLMACNSMAACSDFVFSSVFHRFPDLRIALSEGGVGWMPWLIERMDYVWEQHRLWTAIDRDVRPSEVFKDHIFGCFIADDVGVALRDRIGISQIMWEGDYPHSDSTWPDARKKAAEALADVPDDDVHRIVELNARELYHFTADLDMAATAAP